MGEKNIRKDMDAQSTLFILVSNVLSYLIQTKLFDMEFPRDGMRTGGSISSTLLNEIVFFLLQLNILKIYENLRLEVGKKGILKGQKLKKEGL